MDVGELQQLMPHLSVIFLSDKQTPPEYNVNGFESYNAIADKWEAFSGQPLMYAAKLFKNIKGVLRSCQLSVGDDPWQVILYNIPQADLVCLVRYHYVNGKREEISFLED